MNPSVILLLEILSIRNIAPLGNSLTIQWLGLGTFILGPRFDAWSENSHKLRGVVEKRKVPLSIYYPNRKH